MNLNHEFTTFKVLGLYILIKEIVKVLPGHRRGKGWAFGHPSFGRFI
jgi:hypothetical protein